jgi:hypothetical protein
MTHPMDNYIVERMIVDAERAISLAKLQAALEHSGLQGRFRELLVNELLAPWLPPSVFCGTGTVVSFRNQFRSKTQEDVLLVDRSVSPPVLIDPGVREGVYLRNSILGRIEVKSILEKAHLRDFQDSCAQYRLLSLDLDKERLAHRDESGAQMPELNFLFGFGCAKTCETAFRWFSETCDGSLSVICIANLGLWRIAKPDNDFVWEEYQCQTNREDAERIAAFVALMSNSTSDQHLVAQGRNRLDSLEGGVGQYFNHWQKVD